MTSNKAIQTYRAASPTGQGNTVSATGTKGN
jgi:pilus assembly protein CpaD